MLDSEIKVKQEAMHSAAELAGHARRRRLKTERGYLISSQAGIYALYPHSGAVRYAINQR
jgi:hypothetical protein